MAIKREHPNAVLFYRMGDFFEMFYEDAKIASEVLGLRLTSRAHGKAAKVPLAGFPYHQLDVYLTKMVKAQHRVVIVEQVEDPKLAKGLVKRGVVQIATAGTNPAAIDQEDTQSNRIAALIKESNKWGLAWADIATGEFFAGEFAKDDLRMIAGQVAPVEVVLPEGRLDAGLSLFSNGNKPIISKVESWIWEPTFARQTLLDHFKTRGLKGFGIDHLELAVSAAGALLHYLKGNLRTDVNHLTNLARSEVSGFMTMEAATRRNLELVESLTGNPQATLFAVINHTVTGAGRRLLFNRLLSPLADLNEINNRLDAVDESVDSDEIRNTFRELLKKSGDIQRYLARLATGRGSARDLAGLRDNLESMPDYQQNLDNTQSSLLQTLNKRINPLNDLKSMLKDALKDDPPLGTSEGGMIRDGHKAELDELRQIQSSGRSWLATYESNERRRTGIPKLKVGFNRVFGYYIEISKLHIEKVPNNYIRRQTLVNAERFITPELTEYEEKLLGAEEKINELELEIYRELVSQTLNRSAALQENAKVLAELDFLCGLADLAIEESYCKPELDTSDQIILRDSRHPVVEKLIPPGEQFIPNDLELGGKGKRILIITGPNMSGKSTYLRQVALTAILAQMGSFVPAGEARIGIVDKLFTRIGALDNLAGGESTFLIEMQETASILHNSTDRSLVIFDEVGRGTSTFDGLSLAWSIVEYLHETERLRPRTLFATHFHEMVELEKHLDLVANRNVAVREYENKVVFLRKIIPGGCDRSFGIHVAQMAGLPTEVIDRAREVLQNLEDNDLNPGQSNENEKDKGREDVEDFQEVHKSQSRSKKRYPKRHTAQLSFFDPIESKLRETLENINPDRLTPMEALQLVAELKRILG